MVERLVGTAVLRSEDPRILRGKGRYVDDLRIGAVHHLAFVRSPFPHARIRSVDVVAARAHPGVVAVLTAADFDGVTPPITSPGPEGYAVVEIPLLASGKVRLVGDPVVAVVAASRADAEDACELVDIDYEPLPVGDEPVWDEVPDGVFYADRTVYGDPDAAFERAEHVVRATFDQHRCAQVPMEGHAVLATYDDATDELTAHMACQGLHMRKLAIGSLLGIPANRVRLQAGDIGGSFGQKGSISREELVVCAAAKAVGGSVKWIEDRMENLQTGGQAREESLDVEVALTGAGEILGLRVRMTLDQGAYPVMGLPSALFAIMVRTLLPGPYRLQHYDFESRVVASHKGSYTAYRGPWAVETFVRERLLDLIGEELGIDPVEVRRRNALRAEDLPGTMVTGPTLHGITTDQTLAKAVEVVDYEGFRSRQALARAEGRWLGIGFSTYMEPAPGPIDYGTTVGFEIPPERAQVVVELDGNVTVHTAQVPHGQGHETTLAQLAADELGVSFESVKVVAGDTWSTPFNTVGTGGSRAATMASGAVIGAAREVRSKIFDIAANLLEAAPADLEMVAGQVTVRGTPAAALPLAQVAMMANMVPQMVVPGGVPGLQATHDFHSPPGGWAQATHCCQVEVDLRTGMVEILRYVVAEDCGTIINPAIVAGQVRGGVAQGIASVLYEHSAYDDDGNYVAGTFMDYLVPTASEIPPIEIFHLETPPLDEVNFRGVGEGGAIGAPAAVANAIADALRPFGARVTETYLPPTRILELAGVIPRG